MHQHKDGIESSLTETKTHLDKLQNEITRTLEKISSREKYINNQLEHLLGDFRGAQEQLSESKERYRQASGGVTERSRLLGEVSSFEPPLKDYVVCNIHIYHVCKSLNRSFKGLGTRRKKFSTSIMFHLKTICKKAHWNSKVSGRIDISGNDFIYNVLEKKLESSLINQQLGYNKQSICLKC